MYLPDSSCPSPGLLRIADVRLSVQEMSPYSYKAAVSLCSCFVLFFLFFMFMFMFVFMFMFCFCYYPLSSVKLSRVSCCPRRMMVELAVIFFVFHGFVCLRLCFSQVGLKCWRAVRSGLVGALNNGLVHYLYYKWIDKNFPYHKFSEKRWGPPDGAKSKLAIGLTKWATEWPTVGLYKVCTTKDCTWCMNASPSPPSKHTHIPRATLPRTLPSQMVVVVLVWLVLLQQARAFPVCDRYSGPYSNSPASYCRHRRKSIVKLETRRIRKIHSGVLKASWVMREVGGSTERLVFCCQSK